MDTNLILLPLADIDEDPHQPRTEFDENSLRELAKTIRTRGVKTPISVRPVPDVPGRYIINHGARRYRASLLAGKETIPAHVDPEYTEEDQLIENIQRENLSPKEVAEFIGKLLVRGRKKGEIARMIGKSPAYVTQHVTLLDLPAPLDEVFSSGRCTDVTIINELARLQRNHAEHTQAWLSDKTQDINRTTVKLFKEFLESVTPDKERSFFCDGKQGVSSHPFAKPQHKQRVPIPVVEVEVEGRSAKLLLDKIPTRQDLGWFLSDDGDEFESKLDDVKLIALYYEE